MKKKKRMRIREYQKQFKNCHNQERKVKIIIWKQNGNMQITEGN